MDIVMDKHVCIWTDTVIDTHTVRQMDIVIHTDTGTVLDTADADSGAGAGRHTC